MRKFFYWTLTVLQVLFVVIAYGIQFYSMKRMGMMRYVLFINREWEAQYPIAALQYAAIACLVLLSVGIILYVKSKTSNYLADKRLMRMLIVQVVSTIAFVFFTLAYSTESYRSYYFTSIILAITALIQDIKVLVYFTGQDNSRGIIL